MSEHRTSLQLEADKFDCDLFRIIGRAEKEVREAGDERAARRWEAAVQGLCQARRHVRALMHKRDVEKTL